jgi:membrane-bound lytic murein transglycosylase B
MQALIDEGIAPRLTATQMEAANVSLTKVGAGDTAIPDRPAALIDLVTPGAATEYRLGYRNFYVITRYNRSSFYAAAVVDLAVALRDSK